VAREETAQCGIHDVFRGLKFSPLSTAADHPSPGDAALRVQWWLGANDLITCTSRARSEAGGGGEPGRSAIAASVLERLGALCPAALAPLPRAVFRSIAPATWREGQVELGKAGNQERVMGSSPLSRLTALLDTAARLEIAAEPGARAKRLPHQQTRFAAACDQLNREEQRALPHSDWACESESGPVVSRAAPRSLPEAMVVLSPPSGGQSRRKPFVSPYRPARRDGSRRILSLVRSTSRGSSPRGASGINPPVAGA